MVNRALLRTVAGNQRIIIEMPPRHGKSELGSKYFPPWYLGNFPEQDLILISASDDLAKDFSVAARDVVDEWGQQFFAVQLRAKRKSAARWSTTAGGSFRCAGIEGGIMGRGANVLVIDDYLKNAEHALSETRRDNIYKWYLSTSSTRLASDASIVIIATRWHPKDLIGRLLEDQEKGGDEWTRIRFPALAEHDDPLGRAPGEPLWPQGGFTREWLERRKRAYLASGYDWLWEALYQQNPPETLDSEFESFYFTGDIWFDRDLPQMDRLLRVSFLDPSLGKNEKADYSAFINLDVDRDGFMWIDADIQRRDVAKIAKASVEFCRRYPPDMFGVEAVAFQTLLASNIYEESRATGIAFPIEEVIDNRPKRTRIRGLSPYLARRDIRFRRNSPGVALLLEQLKAFPGGKHDDGPDALAGAIDLAKRMLEGHNLRAWEDEEHAPRNFA